MVFACDMTVFSSAEREEHLATIREVFSAIREIRELPDGYAFRFENEERTLAQVATFVAKERRCCPFFGFRIEVEPEGGPVWLSMTGEDGIKPFIRAEVGPDVPRALATRFDFH